MVERSLDETIEDVLSISGISEVLAPLNLSDDSVDGSSNEYSITEDSPQPRFFSTPIEDRVLIWPDELSSGLATDQILLTKVTS